MPRRTPPPLSRRERQIMDIIYTHTQASVADVLAAMPDPPSYSAVRAMLRILEEKGHLKHRDQAGRYVYLPVTPRSQAAQSALHRVLQTFFGGSLEKALAAHLTDPNTRLSPADFQRLSALIQDAKQRGE
jgi:BlaI family transcriptional regulator, penicillinase repressor